MVKFDFATRQKKAKALREKAKRYLAETQARLEWDEPAMLAMFRNDAADMREIAKFILKNKLDKARRIAESMDTAAREEIPEHVYSWLFLLPVLTDEEPEEECDEADDEVDVDYYKATAVARILMEQLVIAEIDEEELADAWQVAKLCIGQSRSTTAAVKRAVARIMTSG